MYAQNQAEQFIIASRVHPGVGVVEYWGSTVARRLAVSIARRSPVPSLDW